MGIFWEKGRGQALAQSNLEGVSVGKSSITRQPRELVKNLVCKFLGAVEPPRCLCFGVSEHTHSLLSYRGIPHSQLMTLRHGHRIHIDTVVESSRGFQLSNQAYYIPNQIDASLQ